MRLDGRVVVSYEFIWIKHFVLNKINIHIQIVDYQYFNYENENSVPF